MRRDDPPRPASIEPTEAPPEAGGSSFEGSYPPGAILAERYRMVALIGQGGMGEVYLAEDLILGQEVALKFLSEHVEAREGGLERFFAEVRAARLVGHPNVARVHDVGEADGRRFLSMEFVDGEDLSHLLRRIGRLPREKALEIARQLCAGLDAIHSAGILHRDLKPANVMLDGDGNVRITDFGLASSAHDLEDSDEVVGTPAYMAPEQLEGRAASERSEVFSLGLLLYELFTGKRVFQGRTLLALKAEHADRTPATPSSEIADLDPAVEETIQRCLERDPADRPPSVRAVALSLPGGDPLAAAVAEGRTPAPEVVADAPDTDGMSPRTAFLCLTGFLVLVALTVTMTQRFYPSLPPYPPEVLVHEARDFLDEIGHDVSRQDSVHVFEDAFDDVRRGAGAADEGVGRGGESRAPDRMFWYRESPRDLLKWQQFRSHPSWFDPPHVVPGMVRMRMTTRGELRWFSRVPSFRLDAGVREAPDWTPFFEAAGLADLPREEVEPRWSRDVPSDRLYAWELDGDDARVPLRVEAASAGGQPVKFIVRPKDFTLPADPAPQKTGVADLLFLNTFLILAGAVVLAVRNLKSGRAHLVGAMRLGLCMFGALMLDWIGFANHGSRLADELWILRMRLG